MQASSPVPTIPVNSTLPAIAPPGEPTGKIAFTCQIFKEINREQVCMVNADGTDYRRLTPEDPMRHFYPSISPDGEGVMSALNEQSKHYEIYELVLATDEIKVLTYSLGDLNAPEISPDGKSIIFTRFFDDPEHPTTWLMDRDGSNPRQVSDVSAWDPTWSPNGAQVLFASYAEGLSQLLSSMWMERGCVRSAICQPCAVAATGRPWIWLSRIRKTAERELFCHEPRWLRAAPDFSCGWKSQGPSFSPDGQWVAFTAYFDRYEVHGCEIYIIRKSMAQTCAA
ncbi:hypothetical protein [Candidatus Villigracilis affinis]|uniref:TolB family protein n=1 Tax=Candidatus Villigracilis affinis TaxID=3140682 RepID=UPI002A1AA22F|nr:PD40 domain-containing protein [Anaerolineales bacterium]